MCRPVLGTHVDSETITTRMGSCDRGRRGSGRGDVRLAFLQVWGGMRGYGRIWVCWKGKGKGTGRGIDIERRKGDGSGEEDRSTPAGALCQEKKTPITIFIAQS